MSRILRLAHYMIRTAGIKERVVFLSDKYKLDINLVNALASFDPTKTGKYVEWIVRRAKQGNIIYHEISEYNPLYRIEDGPRVREALKLFDALKTKKLLPDPDINKYNLHTLEDLVLPLAEEAFESRNIRGGQEIYSDGKAQITQIGVENDGTGFSVEQFQEWLDAACAYAEGTHWCTKGRENSEYYLNQGPLYVIKLNNKRVAQFHPASQQLMDVKDRPLVLKEYPDIELALWKSPIPTLGISITTDIIRELGEYLELGSPERESELLNYGKIYLHGVFKYIELVRGPWPEAEPFILRDALYSLIYACDIIKRRWPEMEDMVIHSFRSSTVSLLHDLNIVDYMVKYSIVYLKHRWPEFEKILNSKISKHGKYLTRSVRDYYRVLVP